MTKADTDLICFTTTKPIDKWLNAWQLMAAQLAPTNSQNLE
jgi:hypothetical protein